MAQLNLSWDANPPEEMVSLYRVYMNDAVVKEVSETQTVIDNVATGQYKLEVAAINESGEGPKSDPVMATVALPLPSKPTGFTCVVSVNVTVNVNVNP